MTHLSDTNMELGQWEHLGLCVSWKGRVCSKVVFDLLQQQESCSHSSRHCSEHYPKSAGNVCEENDPEVFVVVIDTCEKGEQKMTHLGAG